MTKNKSIVNVNSKELLAKLMSTENIQVRHKKINTAAFDTKNRILYLPIWKEMDNDLYTMFITHEVGHALFTPHKELEETIKREPKLGMILNLVEDARIDRKMKDRFPGVRVCYNEGTRQLQDMDFFEIKKRGKPIDELNLLDRLNLHYKQAIYNHIAPIKFTEAEQEILKEMDETITYNDVIRVSEKILKHIKDQKQKQKEQQQDGEGEGDSKKKGDKKSKKGQKNKKGEKSEAEEESQSGNEEMEDITPSDWEDPYSDDEDEDSEDSEQSGKGNGEETDESDESESGSGDGDGEESDNESDSSQTSGGQEATNAEEDPNDFISHTQQTADKNMNRLNDKNADELIYCNFPKINTRSFVVPFKEVHKQLRAHYSSGSNMDAARTEYNKFKMANQKIVDYLVKEFELKKAAAITSRTKTANTGVLDTRKIHTYKYNDDLFRKVAEIPEGKNHGLVIFVDCSGSMSSNMLGTLQQLINLAAFCRKVGIPYDVYGFTDNMSGFDQYQRTFKGDNISVRQHTQEYKNEDIVLNRFNLRQYFSSRMKAIEHQEAMVNMTALVNSYKRTGYVPGVESLGGTPFDEAIMVGVQLVKDMKAKYSLDMVHAIFLTDGYGTSAIQYKDENGHVQYTSRYGYGSNNVMVRAGNREFDLKNYDGDTNRMFLEILKKQTDANVVGFYICDHYQVDSAIARMTSDSKKVSKLKKDFERDGYLAMQEAGWDEYYVVPNGNDIQVDTNGFQSLNQVDNKNVQKEFVDIFKRQQRSRVILRKFIDKIAKKKELTKKR